MVRVIKSRRFGWTGRVARMKEGRSDFKILTGESTGKKHVGRPKRRWEENIIIYLKEIAINMRNWIDLAKDSDYWRSLMNAPLNLRVP